LFAVQFAVQYKIVPFPFRQILQALALTVKYVRCLVVETITEKINLVANNLGLWQTERDKM